MKQQLDRVERDIMQIHAGLARLRNVDVSPEEADVREQHRLFFFIFEEKLHYDLENGYRTTELPRAATLFETFAVQSSTDVEVPWKISNR